VKATKLVLGASILLCLGPHAGARVQDQIEELTATDFAFLPTIPEPRDPGSAIASDPFGNVYLAFGNPSWMAPHGTPLYIFDAQGEYVTSIRPPGLLTSFADVAADASGRVYAAVMGHFDGASGRSGLGGLLVWEPTREARWWRDLDASSVTVAGDGSLFVLTGNTREIQKYDRQHKLVWKVEKAVGWEFSRLRVSPDGQRVYVAAQISDGKPGMFVFDGQGKRVGEIPYLAPGAVDREGKLLARTREGRPVLLNPDGTVARALPFLGEREHAVIRPDGTICRMRAGALYEVLSAAGEVLFDRSADFEHLSARIYRKLFKKGEEVALEVRFGSARLMKWIGPKLLAEKTGGIQTPEVHAFLQEFGRATWRELAIKFESEANALSDFDTYAVTLPKDAEGLSKLRVVVGEKGDRVPAEAVTPLRRLSHVDFWIPVARATPSVLSVFTEGNRSAFVTGEEIELNVATRDPRALTAPVEIWLRESGGTAGWKVAEKRFGAESTATFVLASTFTAALRAGPYLLSAVCGGTRSNAFEIDLVGTVRSTNATLFADEGGADGYPAIGVPADLETRFLLDALKVNLTLTEWPSWLGGYPSSADQEADDAAKVLASYPGLGVPEVGLRPNRYERHLDNVLKHGRSFLVGVFPADDVTLEPWLWEGRREQIRLMETYAQGLRRYPSWAGLEYTRRAQISWGSSVAKDLEQKARCKAMFEDLKKRTGYDGQMPEGFPDIKPEHPLYDAFMLWTRGVASNLYEDWYRATARIAPAMIHTDRAWNGAHRGAPVTYRVESRFGDLSDGARWLDGQHLSQGQDWWVAPFNLEHAADLTRGSREEGKFAWQSFAPNSLLGKQDPLRFAFRALSRGASPGFGRLGEAGSVSSTSAAVMGAPAVAGSYGKREQVQLLADVLERYGDFFGEVGVERGVTLLASKIQAARGDDADFYGCQLFDAYASLSSASYPPTVLCEEDVERGRLLEGDKVLVVVGQTVPLPEKVVSGIADFQRSGGTVLVADAGVEIPGARPLSVSFKAFHETHQPHGWRYHTAAGGPAIYDRTFAAAAPKAKALREALAGILPPVAECANLRVQLSTLKNGAGRYLFAINMTPLPTDPKKPTGWWDGVPDQYGVLPIREKILLPPGASAVYDVLSGAEVPLSPDGDKRAIEADFAIVPAKLYALLPERIAKVSLSATPAVRPGESVRLRAGVVGPAGAPLDAAVPLRLAFKDPAGKEKYCLYRAFAKAGAEELLPVAINDAPGAWTLEVTELFSGKTAALGVEVRGEAKLPASLSRELGPVVVCDATHVAGLLRSKKTLLIVADGEAPGLSRAASKIEEALRAKGIACELKEAKELLGDGKPTEPKREGFAFHLPSVRGNLILLSLPGGGALAGPLWTSRLPIRHLTENYPGKGRGLVAYAWSPFSGQEDVILLGAGDESGLEKAVSKLLELSGTKPEEAGNYPGENLEKVRLALAPAELRRRLKKGDPFGKPLDALALPPAAEGELSSAGLRETQVPVDFVTPRTGDVVSGLAVSPDGQFVAAGTDAWGNNLYLLDRKGTVLWKKHAPDAWLEQVAVSESAGTVAAGAASGASLKARQAHTFDAKGTARGANLGAGPTGETNFVLGKSRLVLHRDDRKLAGIDLATGTPAWEFDFGAKAWRLSRMAGSDDGSRVACWFEPGGSAGQPLDGETLRPRVILFEAESGKVIWEVKDLRAGGTAGAALDVSPRGDVVALVEEHDDLRVLGPRGEALWSARLPRRCGGTARDGAGWKVEVDNGGTRVVAMPVVPARFDSSEGGLDRAVYVAQAKGGLERIALGGAASGVSISPDGALVALGSWDDELILLDRELKELWRKSTPGAPRPAFAPDGSALLVGTSLGTVAEYGPDGALRWSVNLTPQGYDAAVVERFRPAKPKKDR
jgi:outer membrane protein assembly factor BamB